MAANKLLPLDVAAVCHHTLITLSSLLLRVGVCSVETTDQTMTSPIPKLNISEGRGWPIREPESMLVTIL